MLKKTMMLKFKNHNIIVHRKCGSKEITNYNVDKKGLSSTSSLYTFINFN